MKRENVDIWIMIPFFLSCLFIYSLPLPLLSVGIHINTLRISHFSFMHEKRRFFVPAMGPMCFENKKKSTTEEKNVMNKQNWKKRFA